MNDIKRASTSSNISGAIGASVTINITRQSTAFKHNIKYNFKGSTGTIASNIDTTYAWTIPTSFAALMPNEMSGTGNLIIETMSGTSKVGETKYTMTISIPNYAWTIPTSFAALMPNEMSGTGNLIIETMSGTSKVGETKYTMTISIPNTATFKPTRQSAFQILPLSSLHFQASHCLIQIQKQQVSLLVITL